jgi:hypothetical protein
MLRTLFPPLFPCFLVLFAGCAGVFQNPDLKSGMDPAAATYRCALPPVDPVTLQIFNAFRDTGVVRLPEHEYYLLQDEVLNCAMQAGRPGFPRRNFTDSIGQKDITRTYTFDSPSIDSSRYLRQFWADSFAVYRLDSCGTELLRAFIRNNVPVLIQGTVTIKKGLAQNPDVPREDGNVVNTLFRRFETFDLIYGYQKAMGPSQYLPGEMGDQFVFSMRSTLDFRASEKREIRDRILTLIGGAAFRNSAWLIKSLYVVLPQEKPLRDIYPKILATATAWGMKGNPPEPARVY